MKKINNLSFVCLLLFIIGINLKSYAQVNNEFELNIYKVDPNLVNDFDVIEKGNTFNLILKDDISTLKTENNKPVEFNGKDGNNNFKVTGFITKSTKGGRFSRSGTLGFSTNKLILDSGQDLSFSATSPILQSINPPHANNNELGLLRTISALSLTASPLTLGTSLGISFLASGLLSVYQNGIHDFIWGGLNGSGFSFIESILRKQPDLFLSQGQAIPFTLKEDLKINKGIQKEPFVPLSLSKEKALKRIDTLLKWGDLSGALEIAAKTGQKEKYHEIIKKVSESL